tara:strand:+ start:346 stop:612 length:267 start_codon:yes stop_codon:yes gene_type:complete
MKITSVADMKARFSAYLKASEQGPVVITKNGKPAGVLLGITDEEEIERLLLAYSSRFQTILEKSRREIEETGGLEHEEFWAEVESEQT